MEAASRLSDTYIASQPNIAPHSPADRSQTRDKDEPRIAHEKGTRLANLFHSIPASRALQLWQTLPGNKTPEKKKTPIRRISLSEGFTITIHLLAIAVAVTVAALNLNGLWVGKELTGQSGQDGEKLLALQFTAKLHELFMLASLSHILFSITIERLVFGEGLPLGAVTAGLRFQGFSYLWSDDFLATCITKFSSKILVLPVIIIFTCLGVTVGPSSATAMRPTLGDWPGGGTAFWLNATADDLWPSELSLSSTGNHTCTTLPEKCGSSNTWDALVDNLFKYWGHEALGGIRATPESVQIPGRVSVRTLNVRFRGPSFTLYEPPFTTATIQPAAIADVLNEIRQIWLQANRRCYSAGSRRKNLCSYKDIKWSIDTVQPAVYVACQDGNSTAVPLFPSFTHDSADPNLVNLTKDVSRHGSTSASYIQWVKLEGSTYTNISIGALVRPASSNGQGNDDVYACSVDARWANTMIESSFIGLPYMVNGVPTNWLQTPSSGKYRGQHVTIDPIWAALVNSPLLLPSQDTMTSFDKLLNAANSSEALNDMAQRIEAVLAVLLADRMARVSSGVTTQGNLTDIYQVLQPNGGHIFTRPAPSSSYHPLTLTTTMTAYAFGIRSASGLLFSTLISTLILLIYATVATCYLIYTFLFSRVYVNAWRGMTELLVLALQSDVSGVEAMRNTSAGIETLWPLKSRVIFLARDGHVEIGFVGDGDGSEQKEGAVRNEERVMKDVMYS